MFVGWFWGIGPITYAVLVSFGSYVGMRFYLLRTVDADKKSYQYFNVCVITSIVSFIDLVKFPITDMVTAHPYHASALSY